MHAVREFEKRDQFDLEVYTVLCCSYQRRLTATKYHEIGDSADLLQALGGNLQGHVLDGVRLDHSLMKTRGREVSKDTLNLKSAAILEKCWQL